MDIRVVFYLFYIVYSSYIFPSSFAFGGACRGRTICRGIRDCAPVMSLINGLKKPLKPSVVHFLRSHQCGFADGHPRICCGVIPKTLNIFTKANKAKRKQPEHQIKLNRAPSTNLNVNKLSIYQPEAVNIMNPPHFDITVSTAAPDASTVPYLSNIKRGANDQFRNFGGFRLNDVVANYMDNYDLHRTRRSGVGVPNADNELEVEVR